MPRSLACRYAMYGGGNSLQKFDNLVEGDQRLVACVNGREPPLFDPFAQRALANLVALLCEPPVDLADSADFTTHHNTPFLLLP